MACGCNKKAQSGSWVFELNGSTYPYPTEIEAKAAKVRAERDGQGSGTVRPA